MIKENLTSIRQELNDNVCLVAVSKTKPNEMILEAYNEGQRDYGENKVQDLADKYEALPKDIKWHFIGHLQRNKVKYIAPFVHLVHAVDSLRLLTEINKQALKNNRTINCLLQFHIANEETKFGLSLEDAIELLSSSEFVELQNISIVGVMGMASNTNDTEQIRDEFRTLENYFNTLQGHYFKFNKEFKELSFGMSNDYPIALEEGSTMIRVGSKIFGSR